MKRLFALLAIGLTLSTSVAMLALAPTANAQALEPLPGEAAYAPAATPAAQKAIAAGDQKATPPGTAQPHECPDNGFSCFFGVVMTYIASLFAWLMGVAMVLLDASVYYTVVHMGGILTSGANSLTAIPMIWQIMRDFGNVALIFGFVAIGVETILGVNLYGGGTKLLPRLIIVAVLLNFSLFFASALVDVSNLFATQFYAQINNGAIPGPPQFDNFTTAVGEEGVSNKIMSQLGLATLYGDAMNAGSTIGSASTPQTLFTGNSAIYIGFLSSILFIVAAFVMFSLAFILAARFVTLILLLVISPIGVAAYGIPPLKAKGKAWFDKLLEQAITAPVLILLLYVALKVITDVHFLGSFLSGSDALHNNAWTGAVVGVGNSPSNLTGFAGVLLSFIVAMGLLLAVTMAAKSMSAAGAGAATKLGGMATFGLTAYGMSGAWNMAGRGGRRWAQSKPNSRIRRALTNTVFRPMENARVDIRRVGIPGTKYNVGAGLKAAGAGEAAAPIAKTPAQRVTQGKEWWKKTSEAANKQYDTETRIPRLKEAAGKGDRTEVAKILSSIDEKDLEKKDVLAAIQQPTAAAALPQAKFDKLLESTTLSAADKRALRTNRNEGIENTYIDSTEYKDAATGRTQDTKNPEALAAAAAAGTPVPKMTAGERALRALSKEKAAQLPEQALQDPSVYKNLTLQQLISIQQRSDTLEPGSPTASGIGAWLNAPVPAGAAPRAASDVREQFQNYLKGLNPAQSAEAKSFWNLP